MSKQFVQKNIKLSLEFDRYLANHPREINKIPRGSFIILTEKGNDTFNRNSRDMVERMNKRTSETCVEAMKEGPRWTLRSLTA